MRNVTGFVVLAAIFAACNPASEDSAPQVRVDEAVINDVWHQARLRGVAFRALGQEPGWLLEISNGEGILLETDYGSTRTSMPYVEPVRYQEERRTRFVLEDYDTVVEIRSASCTDTMSGEEFDATVTITQPGKELHGCGRALF